MPIEGGNRPRVLVVEDSQAQRNLLVDLLTRRGYDVSSVGGGLEALKSIRDDPPDVVLLDVILDDLDGYSVCRWIRLADRTREIVVIMLTVKKEPKERVEGLHVGADDYLPKPFDEDELDARIFAALRARAAKDELKERNQELEDLLKRSEKLAMTDPVTGIYNRRRFNDMLRHEWLTARRYGVPLSVALVDLDRFKLINDVDGHAAGDEALRRVAEIITDAVREVDIAARYGGDEFAILLPHTPRDKASIAVQRAQDRIAKRRGEWAGTQRELSLSAGIASTEDIEILDADQLIEAADRALYMAKKIRGKIVVAHDGILHG